MGKYIFVIFLFKFAFTHDYYFPSDFPEEIKDELNNPQILSQLANEFLWGRKDSVLKIQSGIEIGIPFKRYHLNFKRYEEFVKLKKIELLQSTDIFWCVPIISKNKCLGIVEYHNQKNHWQLIQGTPADNDDSFPENIIVNYWRVRKRGDVIFIGGHWPFSLELYYLPSKNNNYIGIFNVKNLKDSSEIYALKTPLQIVDEIEKYRKKDDLLDKIINSINNNVK
jgi:hypothetical protein